MNKALTALACCLLPLAAQAGTAWEHVPGEARSLAANAANDTYATGPDGHVWRWRKTGGLWLLLPGDLARVIVMPDGSLWGIDAHDNVRKLVKNRWQAARFAARDLAPGKTGELYYASPDGHVGRYTIATGAREEDLGEDAQRIAADGSGTLWKIAAGGAIARFVDGAWKDAPGKARMLAPSPDGVMNIVTADGVLSRWDAQGNDWQPSPDAPRGIAQAAFAASGTVWVAKEDGTIFAKGDIYAAEQARTDGDDGSFTINHAYRNGAGGKYRSRAAAYAALYPSYMRTDPDPITFTDTLNKAARLAIGADGSVFALSIGSTPALQRWNNRERRFKAFPGSLVRIAADQDGNPWGINAFGRIFRHTGLDWRQVNGTASEITIGLGDDIVTARADGTLQRYDESADAFFPSPEAGSAAQIAVAPKGVVWGLLGDGTLVHCDAVPCTRYPIKGKSLGVGPDGSVFVVDLQSRLQRLIPGTQDFEFIPVLKRLVESVAVGPKGRPWVVADDGEVYSSAFFNRDENLDERTTATTVTPTTGTGDTGSVTTQTASSFTFNKALRTLRIPTPFGTLRSVWTGLDGRIFALGDGPGIALYNKAGRRFIAQPPLPGGQMLSLRSDAQGKLWGLSSENDGQLRHQNAGGGYDTIQFAPNTPSQNFPKNRALALAKDGSVYAINTAGELYRQVPGATQFLRFLPGLYRSVAVGLSSDVWVIDDGGVLMQVVNGVPMRRPLPNHDTLALSVGGGPDGSIWVVPDDGSGAVSKWNSANRSLDRSNAAGTQVEVGLDGKPLFLNPALAPTAVFLVP